jgi:hypothetical protein
VGLCVDSLGNLIVCDTGNSALRKLYNSSSIAYRAVEKGGSEALAASLSSLVLTPYSAPSASPEVVKPFTFAPSASAFSAAAMPDAMPPTSAAQVSDPFPFAPSFTSNPFESPKAFEFAASPASPASPDASGGGGAASGSGSGSTFSVGAKSKPKTKSGAARSKLRFS